MRKLGKISCFLFEAASCFLITSCGDYRGASEPFSYAPSTSASIWIPPSCIRREPINLDEVDAYEFQEKSLSLGEVIDITLYNNPNTKKSWAEARTAAAQYGQSLKNYFVLSNLTSDYTNYQEALFTQTSTINTATNLNNPGTGAHSSQNTFHGISYGAQLNLSYTILDFGQTRATSKAALAALYEADFSHNNQIQSTVNLIMNDYYTYLSQKSQVVAAEQNVKNATTALDAVLERFKNGLSDVSDKVQATTKLLQEKLNLVSQKQLQTTSYTTLLNDMGFPANAYLTFENYPDKIQLFEIVDLSTLISIASEKRPDLLAAESALKVREEKLKLAQTQKYPVITANLEAGREQANLGIGGYYDYLLSINLNFPLFQGFFIENGIKKAKADIEIARAKLKQKQLSLIQEVTNYFHDVSYSKESYLYAKEFLESAQLDFKVNLERYKAGTSTIVDLINAQTAVTSAQSQLIASEKGWYSSIANLSYSTGVLVNRGAEDTFIQSSLKEDPICSKTLDERI